MVRYGVNVSGNSWKVGVGVGIGVKDGVGFGVSGTTVTGSVGSGVGGKVARGRRVGFGVFGIGVAVGSRVGDKVAKGRKVGFGVFGKAVGVVVIGTAVVLTVVADGVSFSNRSLLLGGRCFPQTAQKSPSLLCAPQNGQSHALSASVEKTVISNRLNKTRKNTNRCRFIFSIPTINLHIDYSS